MKIDITKPVKCRDGRYAEVACEKDNILYGRIKFGEGWEAAMWSITGIRVEGCFRSLDIIQEPEKKKITFWVNVYSDGKLGGGYLLMEEARALTNACGEKPVACLKIEREYFIGEGCHE